MTESKATKCNGLRSKRAQHRSWCADKKAAEKTGPEIPELRGVGPISRPNSLNSFTHNKLCTNHSIRSIMPKKGVSKDEKRSRAMQYLYEKKEPFMLKDLERDLPKFKGIIGQVRVPPSSQ
jgi:hypothetical protein